MTGNAAATSTRDSAAAIGLAIGIVSIVGIGLSLSIPLLSLEMERRGITSTMNGLNTAVGGIATMVMAPFVPALAGRFGVRRVLLAALLLGAIALPAFAISPFWAWFPLRFAYGVSLCTLFVLSEFWINAAAPPDRRGFVMGLYATVLSLGFAAGPAILALVGTQGWPPYLCGAALFALSIVPLAFARDSVPVLPREPQGSVLRFLRMAPAATLAAFIFGAVETGGFSLLPVYGLRNGFDAERSAFLVSLVALGNVLFQIPAGLIADRIDRRKVLLFAATIGMVGAALIPFVVHHGMLLNVLLVVWGGVIGALYTVGLAHLGARFAGADLAQANAAFIMLYSAGLIVGPPLLGAGMDAADPHGLAWSISVLFLFYLAVVGWRMVFRPKHG